MHSTAGGAKGWLYRLAEENGHMYAFKINNRTEIPRLEGGPGKGSAYISCRFFTVCFKVSHILILFLALYFTMTCMATIGFGNIAGNTVNEKIFCICIMVISGKK